MLKYGAAMLLFFISCKKDSAGLSSNALLDTQSDILFISRRVPNSAEWQIVTMGTDGNNQHLLTNRLVFCTKPFPSNDGNRIAFMTYEDSRYRLYVINKDGNKELLLADGIQYCGSPAWSPDDTKIAFVKNDFEAGGNLDIYLINSDGSNETQLTRDSDNFSPAFLNNDLLLYNSGQNNEVGVYQSALDGTDVKRITPTDQSFGRVVISPDKTRIAVTSLNRQGSQIFVMNTDGSDLKQLTFTVAPNYFDTGFPREGNSDPVWSPDSKHIAYVSFGTGSADIFTIRADGKDNRQLTDSPIRDENPSWTKDGNHLIFSSNRNMDVSAEIYIMRADGKSQQPLTHFAGDDIYPVLINK